VAWPSWNRWIVLLCVQRGRRCCGGVAGQDVFEQLGSGGDASVLGSQDRMRVSVADHGKVQVVGRTATGQHCVEESTVLGAGSKAVHGVDRGPLGSVHGAGVAEWVTRRDDQRAGRARGSEQ
jgi:hypothetical protein